MKGEIMKATGIVRRIDELGRVVIPKEIRRTLRIRVADPLEIFTDHEGAIVLKKYSPIGELGSFAKQYAESLSQVSGHLAIIADRDQIIAAAGGGSKHIIGKSISKGLEEKMNQRETVCTSKKDQNYVPVTDDENTEYQQEVIIPIITHGDVIGAVVLLSTNSGEDMTEVELKLAQSAAGFLGKQMEE
jgi:AbrB family transcriptional regulator (stage V sporulation protein T)